MTVNVARKRTRSASKTAPKPADLPIGDIDHLIFACPACARPLATGARRCPGCGTRLVLGVQAKRVSIFVGIGLAVGLAVGGGVATAAFTADRLSRESDARTAAAAAAAASASASPAPTATASPTHAPGASPSSRPVSDVPALSRSALVQALAINGRLATSSTQLGTALAARQFDAFEVSQILRTMSTDAVVGLSLTSYIASWSGGTRLSTDLATFYSALQTAAGEGLSASVRNVTAYRAAGATMLTLLGGLGSIDASVQAAAADAGVTIPPASPTP
jgi:hypothetical protein